MYFGKEFGLPYRLIRFLLLSKRDSPLVGESRVPGEKRGDLCGIGGFQKKCLYQTNKRKHTCERISPRKTIRFHFNEDTLGVLWVQRNLARCKGLQN